MRGPFPSRDAPVTHSRHPSYTSTVLRQVARDCLRDNPGDLATAREAFRATVYSDIELLRALCEWLCRSYGDVHTQYISDVAAEDATLRAASTRGKEFADASGGVHTSPASRAYSDPAARADLASEGASNAKSSDASGGVQNSFGSRTSGDPSARAAPPPRSRPTPSPAEIREALRAAAGIVTKSVLDTFRVDDGRPVGDLTPDEVDALLTRRTRQNRFLELLVHGLPREQKKPIRHYYVGPNAKRPDEIYATAMRGGDA